MKFFPAMVKFGLPDPVACWAKAAGIPIRRVAIQLAERYKDMDPIPSYESFLSWLGTLSLEQLQYDFSLQSPFLEDIHKAIFTSGLNPILRGLVSLEALFPFETQVYGVRYDNRAMVAFRSRVGDTVSLSRDYDTHIDRNAINVYLHGQQLGYVPRRYAQILAPEMDIGMQFDAQISRVQRVNEFPSIYINVFSLSE